MGRLVGDARRGFSNLHDSSLDGAESGTVPATTTHIPPSFDPRAFSEESDFRERAPTLIDEEATEQARIASVLLRTDAPPPVRASNVDALEATVGVDAVQTISQEEETHILRASLAPLRRVPRLARRLTELGSLLADPKTAYVLGFVDGVLPLETIIEVTGLPELDTLRILDRVVEGGVIVFRPRL